MKLTVAFVAALIGLFAAVGQAPPALGLDHGGEATPQASPGAGNKHDEMDMGGTGAAYMIVRNAAAEDDRVVGGEAPVARVVEIHEVVDVEGVMEMRPLADGLDIPAGGEETLQPGGYHVMLIGLTEDLTNGMTFDLTLEFEHAGEVTVPVTVRLRPELPDGATSATVNVGEITIEDAWSRPAPALGGMATPEATPGA